MNASAVLFNETHEVFTEKMDRIEVATRADLVYALSPVLGMNYAPQIEITYVTLNV